MRDELLAPLPSRPACLGELLEEPSHAPIAFVAARGELAAFDGRRDRAIRFAHVPAVEETALRREPGHVGIPEGGGFEVLDGGREIPHSG